MEFVLKHLIAHPAKLRLEVEIPIVNAFHQAVGFTEGFRQTVDHGAIGNRNRGNNNIAGRGW